MLGNVHMDPTLLAKGFPSWAFHYVIVGLVWFGLNFLFITPIIYDRATLPLRAELKNQVTTYQQYYFLPETEAENIQEYLDCLYGQYFYEKRMDITIWTSSMGFLSTSLTEQHMQHRLDNFKNDNSCGVQPWGKQNEK